MIPRDAVLGLFVFIAAFCLRAPFLWYPPEPVGDEDLYLKLAMEAGAGAAYYDLHPPLSKMIDAAVLRAQGAAHVPGASPSIPATDGYQRIRAVSVVFGSIIPVLVFLICRALRMGRIAASAAAALAVLDSALIVFSRSIMPDAKMLAFGLCASYIGLAARDIRRRSVLAMLAASAGAFVGLASAVKWTGLAFIVPAMLPFLLRRSAAAILIPVAALILYSGVWAVHLKTIGMDGRWTFPPFAAVPGHEEVTAPPPASWAARIGYVGRYHELMARGHRGEEVYARLIITPRPPEMWPLLKGGINLWGREDGRYRIRSDGNPFAWAVGGVSVLCALGYAVVVLVRRRVGEGSYAPSLLLIAFAANYLPFFFIERPLSNYHYFPALTFSFMLAGWVIDRIGPSDRKKAATAIVLIAAIFLALGSFNAYGFRQGLSFAGAGDPPGGARCIGAECEDR